MLKEFLFKGTKSGLGKISLIVGGIAAGFELASGVLSFANEKKEYNAKHKKMIDVEAEPVEEATEEIQETEVEEKEE